MIDSNTSITNLHTSSNVMFDASIPNVVRNDGQMCNKDDKREEVNCVIPYKCYSTVYYTIIKDCQANKLLDWTSTSHVSNAGLMAQKADEYASYDKTFERYRSCH